MPPKRKKGMKNVGVKRRKLKENGAHAVLSTKIKKEPESSCKREVDDVPSETNQKTILIDVEKHRQRIRCNECNKKFRFRKSYNAHKELEHSKLPGSVQCPRCIVCCPNSATLQDHIRNFHEREIHECDKCKKKFVRYAHVLRHKAQSGCDGKQVAMYPCEICQASFSRKDNLMVHLRMQHILRKKYNCKQCRFTTGSFSKIIIHMQKKHSDTPQQYECDHCGKVTSSRAAICKHLEIHGEKKFACDVCNYKTHTLEVMRRHVLTHVEDKPYKCAVCRRTFIQRAQLLRHALKHSDNKCLVCSKTFKDQTRLVQHSRVHYKHGAKMTCPAADCEEYGTEFKSLTELNNHIKTHINDTRPYACEVCNKTFRKEMDMRRHVTSHTLERPRRCMYCVKARAYVRGEQLVKHVRKAHPAVFKEHLLHIRQVLGVDHNRIERVKKSELDSILQVLDAEAERILQGYGEGVLYGGMQEADDNLVFEVPPPTGKSEVSPLMPEEELAENMNKLLIQLIDKDLLECFGWPNETVDTVLEKVIAHCGAKPADREKWTRVQCLRENAKHLFLYVIEDKTIARMLYSHTIDQIINHILTQVAEEDNDEEIEQND